MSDDRPAARRAPAKGVWFVLSAVFIDMVGIGIAIPVLPVLIGDYTADRATQALWFTALTAAYGVMQFLCAPILGAISDRFGRRPVLLAAIVGLGVHYLLIAIAPSLWVMLLARLLGGITGASFSVANAYLADVSPPEERAKSFGMIGAAFGLGFICGPPLGGVLGEIDLHLPFYVAAGLSFVNAIYGFLVVPESLPPERRSPFSLYKANPFRALIALVRQHAIGSVVIAFTLYITAHMTMIQTWVLFTHFRFGWSTLSNGILLGCVGVLSAVVQGGLLGRLVKWLGEERLALIAIGTNVVALILYGLAPQGWMMFAILFAGFIVFAAGPSLQSLVSKSTDPAAQGITLGAMQSINSLAFILGAVFGNGILASVSELPPADIRVGASFFFCAFLQAMAFLVLLRRHRGRAETQVAREAT
jgi:DHA1 family tetracycline resistance protein-like MFS transporter